MEILGIQIKLLVLTIELLYIQNFIEIRFRLSVPKHGAQIPFFFTSVFTDHLNPKIHPIFVLFSSKKSYGK